MKTVLILFRLCVLTGMMALLLAGCHEVEDDYVSKYCPGSCTVIKGRVSANNGTVPVAGATVLLQWQERDYPAGGTTRNKAFATTDKNGFYELRFLLRDDELQEGYFDIIAAFDSDKYVSCQELTYIPRSSLRRDTIIIQNYTVAPMAALEIAFKAQEPLSPTDALRVIFKYKLSPADLDSCMVVFDAAQQFHENPFAVPANTPLAVYLEKTKAGARTTGKDVLTLQPGETRTYEITF